MLSVRAWLIIALGLPSCTKGVEPASPDKPPAERIHATSPPQDAAAPDDARPAGVSPDKFECASLVSAADLTQLLGGTATPIDSPTPTPRGVARPCSYQVAAGSVELWVFDLDCRDNYQKTADALFEQYKKLGGVDILVGAKAIDHSGRAILFVDDDAPCYVRVIGNDATKRLELAKRLAKNLTLANAPMAPRPAN